MGLSPPQKGNIVESQIANLLILLSDGSLTPNLPVVDDYGIDIVLGAKGTVASLFIQVKSRFKTSNRYANRLDFQIEKPKLIVDPKSFLLCVYFDQTQGNIDTMWLISSITVERKAVPLEKYYRIVASRSGKSEDRWAEFKVTSEKLVTQLLSNLTKGMGNTAKSRRTKRNKGKR